MYQKAWKMQPPIGEDFRHNVCREVHSKMLKKDEVKVRSFVTEVHSKLLKKGEFKVRSCV